MKAYFQHLQWVIDTQERIARAEQLVIDKEATIENMRQKIRHLQDLLNTSHREKRELQQKDKPFSYNDLPCTPLPPV